MAYYKVIRPLLFLLPPETGHNLAIWALSKNLIPQKPVYKNKMLVSTVFGREFQNPVGLAAGFDKNANCIDALSHQGFGFIEVGTVTPLPQKGNPRPRLFRVKDKQAVINRMGFNNDGLELYCQKLRQWKYAGFSKKDLIVGANIGKNKTSENNASDYITGLEKVYGLCDYLVINISSPNTPGLRELQKKDALAKLLTEVKAKKKEIRTKYKGKLPLLLKISPDESDENLADIAKIAVKKKIDAVIISNTTVNKAVLSGEGNKKSFAEKKFTGGISGKPLFEQSTAVIEKFYKLTEGKVPIIGVGGVSSAEDAYAKIRKGASLVQIYSALIYQGFNLPNHINKGLVSLLEKDGFSNISEAVGADVELTISA